jgi:hypothetical protein
MTTSRPKVVTFEAAWDRRADGNAHCGEGTQGVRKSLFIRNCQIRMNIVTRCAYPGLLGSPPGPRLRINHLILSHNNE